MPAKARSNCRWAISERKGSSGEDKNMYSAQEEVCETTELIHHAERLRFIKGKFCLYLLVRTSFAAFCFCGTQNNSLHLYSAFLGTQSALHRRGESPQPPSMCSIHLDDATAAILHQNAQHTPAYWWRGDRVMKPISVWGWWGGHDAQRPMGEFGQDAGVTPLLFFEWHPGIFNDHRESGPRFNI